MAAVRLLGLAASLSVLTAGLVGLAATYLESERSPITVGAALRSPEGSRVLVRGLLGEVHNVTGGAALSTLSDCAGTNITVFFASAPPAALSWRLVDLDAKAARYKGAPELSVESGAQAREAPAPFAVVEPEAVMRDWRALLCTPIAVHAPVEWAHRDRDDPLCLAVGVYSSLGTLHVSVHADVILVPRLDPGASVTFIGVLAASKDGTEPVLHVRV